MRKAREVSAEAAAGVVHPIVVTPKFRSLPADKLESLVANCMARGFTVELVADARSACQRVEQLIPEDADVSTGGSTTLSQIGLLPLLEGGQHRWRYRRAGILAEPDEKRRHELRRAATTCDYFVGSVNALTLDGRAICADYGGTRVGSYAYGAGRVIWVVGTNKVVDTLEAGLVRLREFVLPKEDERCRTRYGIGSKIGKLLIVEDEPQRDRIRLLLVDEALGF